MDDTIHGDFSDAFCSDCGQKVCSIKHWGQLNPKNMTGYFDSECFELRLNSYDVTNQQSKPLVYDFMIGSKLSPEEANGSIAMVCPHTLEQGWPLDGDDYHAHTTCKGKGSCGQVAVDTSTWQVVSYLPNN